MESYQIILLTIFLGLAVTAVFYVSQVYSLSSIIPSSNSKPTFLILGTTGSGKTSFFQKLAHHEDEALAQKFQSTVMSQEENVCNIRLPLALEKSTATSFFEVIDFPGHLKFQTLLLHKLADVKVKGILFMIDSSSSDQQLADIGKYLFKILKITERKTNGIDFCIGLNKTDLFNSKPGFRIQRTLETEINKLIKNNLSNLNNLNEEEEEDEDNDIWGQREFKFEQLDGNMEFCEGSVLKNKTEKWENWFDERSVN